MRNQALRNHALRNPAEPHRPSLRSALPKGLAILLSAVFVAALLSGCASKGKGKGEEREIFRRVRPPVAFEMLRDNRDMPLFDLRTEEEFSGPLGHLVGARNLPLRRLTTGIQGFENLKQTTFLIYCRGPLAETRRAGDVAERAREGDDDPERDSAVEEAVEEAMGNGPPPPAAGGKSSLPNEVHPSESCAERALAILLDAGFENVMVMDGGIEAWVEMGFGTVGGSAGGIRPRGMPERPLDQGEKQPSG